MQHGNTRLHHDWSKCSLRNDDALLRCICLVVIDQIFILQKFSSQMILTVLFPFSTLSVFFFLPFLFFSSLSAFLFFFFFGKRFRDGSGFFEPYSEFVLSIVRRLDDVNLDEASCTVLRDLWKWLEVRFERNNKSSQRLFTVVLISRMPGRFTFSMESFN